MLLTRHLEWLTGLAGCVLSGLLLVLVSGCAPSGPQRVAISGSVTFDGKPVPKGMIAFISTGGGPSTGGKIIDGRYDVPRDKGPLVGNNKVQIQGWFPTGRKIPIPAPVPTDEMMDETVQLIPEKYNAATELTLEVMADTNTHDFDLTP